MCVRALTCQPSAEGQEGVVAERVVDVLEVERHCNCIVGDVIVGSGIDVDCEWGMEFERWKVEACKGAYWTQYGHSMPRHAIITATHQACWRSSWLQQRRTSRWLEAPRGTSLRLQGEKRVDDEKMIVDVCGERGDAGECGVVRNGRYMLSLTGDGHLGARTSQASPAADSACECDQEYQPMLHGMAPNPISKKTT